MNRLETIVAGIKSQIGAGIEPALKFLEQHLSPESPRYNDFIQIKSRYNSLQRELLLGTIDQNTYNQWRNSLSSALLLFADELTEADFITDVKRDHAWDDKRGDILYYIPDRMLLNREEKCAVRLAWLEEALLRDWTAREADVRKEIRMADIMAVELLNLDERQPFQIRTLSEAVQFVDNDDYTEWVFYVKPLMEGEYALVLRVSVIEIIREKEYKKDIVLEERVQVLTREAQGQDSRRFRPANFAVTLGDKPPENKASQPAAPAAAAAAATPTRAEQSMPQSNQPVLKTAGQSVIRQVIIGITASATLFVATVLGIPYYKEAQAWKKTRYCGKPHCARTYLQQYPNGRHKDEALLMLSDTLAILPRDSVTGEGPATFDAPDMAAVGIDQDGFMLLPEDTIPFSLEAWEKAQTRTANSGRRSKVVKPRISPAPAPSQGNAPEIRTPEQAPAENPKVEPEAPDDQYVYLKKEKEFPIVQSGKNVLNFRYLKFNSKKEVFAVLHNLNGNLFRPGQEIEFVAANGQVYRSSVLYSAIDPDRGETSRVSRAFFQLDAAAVKAFAAEKITQIRVINPVLRTTELYSTTSQTQRGLNRRTLAVLEEMGK